MLGPLLMVEMIRRLRVAGHAPTEPLLRDAGQQGAYCIDAPDEMPAGGVEWFCDPDLPEIAGPIERMVPRETDCEQQEVQ